MSNLPSSLLGVFITALPSGKKQQVPGPGHATLGPSADPPPPPEADSANVLPDIHYRVTCRQSRLEELSNQKFLLWKDEFIVSDYDYVVRLSENCF